MAEKKTAAGFDFLVSALKANKGAQYSDLKAKADKKGLTVYPVMFGRAKALLGLVKTARRGQGKAAKAAGARRGRPQDASSKSGQVRDLLSKGGMTPAEIAKRVGCSVNLVYAVKAAGRGGARPTAAKRGPGRPAKSTNLSGLDAVVAALRDADRERERFTRALQQIRAIVEGMA